VRTPTARRSWRDKVRHAVDLTVAFVTLDDAPYEDDHAFEELGGPSATAVDRHPHRTPLRPMPRSRRPGAAGHRPQICIAPVRPESAAPKRRSRIS
jgi:hypothetical protein